MGKKLKVGKSRKDRFYHLAKETGYRSRAAFKLIQLNRKFEFLQRSNIIIDLCAAPGGWLQVAAENAPMSNVIIGIDLVPISPIRNVKTFQEDITSEKCRQILRKELHTAKADCVLNDGAPNVGKNWLHDAYQQAELTLHALRLATDFLRKGGWFITKVFRSKDYDPLLWVFGQLFKNVHATKPQASRSESAEIFVVCQGFLAPDKIDPKFLDPKCVFQEVDKTPRPSIDLIHPEKKRRQREGYPEGDYTLFYSLPVSQFLNSEDYMNLLAQSSEIALDSEEIKNHPLTTSEIRECIKDIKVLGKKEIKAIFTWRKKLKKELEKKQEEIIENEKLDKTEEKEEESVEKDVDDAEVEELETLLEQKNQEELAAMKKAKKKIRKAQMKQKIRIDMKMTIPGDMPDIQDDINIFDIKKIRNPKQLNDVEKGDLSYLDKEDIFEDSDDEGKQKHRPRQYYDKDVKVYRGVAAGDSSDEEDMEEEPTFTESLDARTQDHGENDAHDEAAEDDDENEDDDKDTSANPLIVDLGETQRIRQDKQTAWFQKAAFADLDDDLDENVELSQIAAVPEVKTGKTQKKKAKPKQKLEDTDSGFGVDDSESDDVDDNSESDESDDDDDDDNSEEDGDYDFNEALGGNKRNKKTLSAKSSKMDGIEVVPKSSLDSSEQLDSEGLAIGAAMIQSRKRKREILDSAYHRYMFDDDNLPDWFVTDEKRHVKILRPVSKEEMEEYKLKMKAIDAQPIKKIAEAKARKKKKLLVRREKARKKANAISDSMDVSEKEKWQQIKQVYKKAGLLNKAKQSVTYVVAKKGAGRKVRRPAGVKGHFKVVDGRMKKDIRAQKKKEAKGGKRKGKKSGHKGRS